MSDCNGRSGRDDSRSRAPVEATVEFARGVEAGISAAARYLRKNYGVEADEHAMALESEGWGPVAEYWTHAEKVAIAARARELAQWLGVASSSEVSPGCSPKADTDALSSSLAPASALVAPRKEKETKDE
jgi:hypothetical protein